MTMQWMRTMAIVALAASVTACGTLSVSEEKRLGAAQQRQVRESLTLLRDPVVVDYVRKLGATLSEGARPSPFDIRMCVVEDESLNAFATFGGSIYIHTGIINASEDVSELAGVIAHEIGHVTARHLAQNARTRRNTGVLAQIAAVAVAVVTGNPYLAQGGELLTGLSATAFLNSFTREFEAEADELAVETLINSGYDPEGMIRLFRTLKSQGGGGGIRFLQDHPTNDERISSVEKMIEEAGFPSGKTSDGGRLEIIKKRIELIAGTDAEFFGKDDEDGLDEDDLDEDDLDDEEGEE